MSPDTFTKMLDAMTADERKATLDKLAKSMVQPRRGGRLDYDQPETLEDRLSAGFAEGDDGEV